MNNPFLPLINAVKRGANPVDLMRGINDPRAAQAIRMINGRSGNELRQIAENMCRERGTTPDEIAKSLGLK